MAIQGHQISQKRQGGSTTQQGKRLKKTLERCLIIRSEPIKGARESGQWKSYYEPGECLVPEYEYGLLPFQMKVLHDKFIHLGFGGYGSHAARNFTDKVLENHHFLTEDPARLIGVKFVDIWNIFNLSLISSSMVRLWALYLAKENRRLKSAYVQLWIPFTCTRINLIHRKVERIW
jgi:hypothetical protein